MGVQAEPRPGVTQPPPSRPTTPLRPSSRSSVRSACFGQHGPSHGAEGASQPAIVALQSQFSELADSISDLEANFMHLQLMHESLSRFNENFASFLYGLNMNAFSVDFPEGPIPLSFKRAKGRQAAGYAGVPGQHDAQDADVESTFLSSSLYLAIGYHGILGISFGILAVTPHCTRRDYPGLLPQRNKRTEKLTSEQTRRKFALAIVMDPEYGCGKRLSKRVHKLDL
ncbi:hypothetical protein KEM56_004441 [Ascosphaera pollenicola]|nr:hypothetical protein KEM56_004441 [Ascosphaera pollenicola]